MNTATPRLVRSRNDKMIAGVAAGIGHYLAIDPVIVRLAFVALSFSGIGLLLYPILWLIMPLEQAAGTSQASYPHAGREVFVATSSGSRRARFDPMTGQPLDPEQEIPIQNLNPTPNSGQVQDRRNWTLGLILIGLGAFFVLKMIVPGGLAPFIFPALLIGLGVWLLRRNA